MKIENSIQSSLAYQKQLFNAVEKLVNVRTELIKSAVLLINEGKDKEWPSLNSQVKFLRKNIDKSTDKNLKTVSEIARQLEKPILDLESNLELKNSFVHILNEQTLEVKTEVEI